MALDKNILKTDHVISMEERKDESKNLPTDFITSFSSRPCCSLFEVILCYVGIFLLAFIFCQMINNSHKEEANG